MSTETPYHILYDEKLGAVVMDWDGYATSEQFREGTELMLNVMMRYKTGKVLANIKDMILIGREDQDWLEKTFLPRAISFGFRFIAIIRPDNYFNNVAVESISYKIDKEKLGLQFFDSKTEAISWLKSI